MRATPFLRLAFWLRGNRRVSRKGTPLPGSEEESGATTPVAAAPAAPPSGPPRAWGALVLRLLGAVAVALALGGGAYGGHRFLHHSPHFAIRAVRISPTTHVRPEALHERADVALGQNLFSLDLGAVQRRLAAEPWLKSVRVRREMPATVAIDVAEYRPAALVALGPLYLADEDGVVFKRATPDEGAGLPVITGIARDTYLSDRAEAVARIQEALRACAAFRAGGPARPAIGEIHDDEGSGITLYTVQGVAIRLGQVDPAEWPARLRRLDAVWARLQKDGQRPIILFVDNRAHPDHITVRLDPGG